MLIKNILFGVKFPSENVCDQHKTVYIVSNENNVEEHIPLSFHRYLIPPADFGGHSDEKWRTQLPDTMRFYNRLY